MCDSHQWLGDLDSTAGSYPSQDYEKVKLRFKLKFKFEFKDSMDGESSTGLSGA